MQYLFKRALLRRVRQSAVAMSVGRSLGMVLATLVLAGCMSTNPKMGGSEGNTITGAAGGASAEGENNGLEKCDVPLGTLSVFEDTTLTWWHDYRSRYPKLGSTVPVIRLMIQQSNCFVVVERGRAMAAMNRERELMQSGQLRAGSNLGGAQMVAADFTISPEIMFAEQGTQGMKAIGGALLGSFGSILGGGLSKNEASTTLILIDNRSGVQVSAAVGSAGNYDFSLFGGFFGGFAAGGASGFSKTPEGKIITAAFADSFNQMVKALRVYKAQEVKGGLGKGGQLQIGGADDKMPTATNNATIPVSAPAPAPVPAVVTTTYVESSNHTVNKSRNYNFDIDEYDEDAFNDYFRWLKDIAPTFTAIATLDPENNSNSPFGGMSISSMAAMLLSQLDSHRIELEAWPYEARQEAWRVMGKRIEDHSKVFERNRQLALKNEKLPEDVRNMIASIQLVTKESLFPENVN